MKVFRYYWFVVCIEAALIFGLAGALAAGAFAKTRLSWLGLFSVATLLYIQMTDAFLGVHSMSEDWEGQAKHRVRTMVAGSIMTATVNCFLIIALGMTEESAPAEAAASEKATAV
ncbi:hypothetical protein GPECTOR_201g369 [Gonium pectorale]|uniref:Uncharacterized protein n=1 Tax=Gonium pectorale TaxID=33097 RepID=A0A150FWZ2_GONPE|nr:hypothetical protein GPECTOR_201g369 [Gonium pectorale]|eukprot:KXZ42119.1 hypothetical protein GPECTOR_201g369 [Gonium pectorale]